MTCTIYILTPKAKTKKVDTVIHIMKMGNKNRFTVGNWNQQTNFQQGKRNVFHYENRLKSYKRSSFCTENILKAVTQFLIC